jgi:hypothetical protein
VVRFVSLDSVRTAAKFFRRYPLVTDLLDLRLNMATQTAPYMLLFRDVAAETYSAMSAEQRDDLMQQWNAWYDGLAAQGKVQHGHPLEPKGRTVSGARGERVVDGPFAEAKEAIGGYFLLTVADIDEATEIAQRCPSLLYGMTVEVRAVAEACSTLGVKGRPQAKREPATV